MKKPNLPIIILCLAICVSGIAALSLKTFHTVNSTTSPYLLYLKVLQGNQQFYNVESGDYLDIHQLKETITSDNLPFSIQQFAIVDLTQNGIKDVVLQFSLAENNQAGFIILHDESGTIYSYTLVSRSMSDLNGSTEMYRCPGHPLTPISVTSIFSASIIIAEPSSTRIYSNLNISPSEFS